MTRREDKQSFDRSASWLVHAVQAGFVATAVMMFVLLAAYGLAASLGSTSADAPVMLQWLWALAHNPVTDVTRSALALAVMLHFAAGLGWAIAYARLAEPRLRGSGWRRGVLFSLGP